MDGYLLKRWRRLRVPAELLWTSAVIAVAALVVQLTGTGVDLLALLILGAVIVVFEWACGDWMSDFLGPNVWSAVLACVAGVGVWSLVAQNGTADHLFRSAERSGYHTLYYDSAARRTNVKQVRGVGVVQTTASRLPIANSAVGAAATAAAGDVVDPASAPNSPPAVSTPAVQSTRLPWSRSIVSSVMRIEAPEIAATGSTITIRAHLTAGGEPVSGVSIAFTANGRSIGVSTTDPKGIASTTFTTRAAAQYEIRAHFGGTRQVGDASTGALLYVIPGRS